MSLMFVFIHLKVLQSKGGRCSAVGGKENKGEKNSNLTFGCILYVTYGVVHERISHFPYPNFIIMCNTKNINHNRFLQSMKVVFFILSYSNLTQEGYVDDPTIKTNWVLQFKNM